MAAKTLKEIIDERNFRTAAEKMAFAFGWNAAMDIKEARPKAHNKQSVTALWRALSSDSVKKQCVKGGVWLPLTKERLNAAYIKVFGL
jgi:hypothetical protein